LRYSLDFSSFSIDFEVDEIASRHRTVEYSNVEDFLFIVADISLRIGNTSYLVVTEFQTDNLIITLENLGKRFSNPPSMSEAERFVPKGGVSEWLRAYWNHIQSEVIQAEEEELYKTLISFSAIEDRNDGRIVIYSYESLPIIEISARVQPNALGLMVWSAFNPAEISIKLEKLIKSIKEANK